MKTILDIINNDYENIQEMIYEDCIIPKGTFMEIYVNPDGIYEEDLTSDGYSMFLYIDKDITYFNLLEADIYDGCSVKNNEVRIDIITKEDEYNRLKECEFVAFSKYV